MAQESRQQGGDLFIVDNSDQDWKVRRYLHDWADLAHSFDIATGYFEVGALLALALPLTRKLGLDNFVEIIHTGLHERTVADQAHLVHAGSHRVYKQASERE
jgi:hypothetical protein